MFIDYLVDNLGDYKKATTDYRFCCPFCGDEKYKLYISEKSTKQDWYHCFHCGASGQPVKFVMSYNHVGYKDALDQLAVYDYEPNYHGATTNFIIDNSLSPEEQLLSFISQSDKVLLEHTREEKLTCPLLPIGYTPLINNLRNPHARPFLEYLNKRGFNYKDIQRHSIGYVLNCPFKLHEDKIIQIRNHLVFLTYNDQGEVIYWNTRSIEQNSFMKSINAPVGEHTYAKSNVVFNLNNAKKKPIIVLTEGVPDAIMFDECGIATFGKAVTDEQIQLITKDLTEDQRLYLMLDEDAKDVSNKLAERIIPYHKNTYIVINPLKKDANSLGRKQAWETVLYHSVKADAEGRLLRLLN